MVKTTSANNVQPGQKTTIIQPAQAHSGQQFIVTSKIFCHLLFVFRFISEPIIVQPISTVLCPELPLTLIYLYIHNWWHQYTNNMMIVFNYLYIFHMLMVMPISMILLCVPGGGGYFLKIPYPLLEGTFWKKRIFRANTHPPTPPPAKSTLVLFDFHHKKRLNTPHPSSFLPKVPLYLAFLRHTMSVHE